MTDITPGVEQFMRMIRSICESCDVEIIECAITALVEERDQAVKENSNFKANSQTFLAATKFTMDTVVAEQERLAAENAELRAALELENPALLDAIDQRMEEK